MTVQVVRRQVRVVRGSPAAAYAARDAAQAAAAAAEQALADLLAFGFGLVSDYSAVVTYNVGDKVFYEGSSYECHVDGTLNTPPPGGPWQLIASGGLATSYQGEGAFIIDAESPADAIIDGRRDGVSRMLLDADATRALLVRHPSTEAILAAVALTGALTVAGGGINVTGASTFANGVTFNSNVTIGDNSADVLSVVATSAFGQPVTFNSNAIFAFAPRLPTYTVGTVPGVTAARLIYVSDESGGPVVAYSDGANWRRVTDRAIVS